MADPVRKLNRRQLLELLVAQGKELEAQRQATERAEARVAELEEKLERVTDAALETTEILALAKQEADAYVKARKAEADALAAGPGWMGFQPGAGQTPGRRKA